MKPVFYPVLGAVADLGFVRVSGAGLGNGFFAYFNAVVLAELTGGRVISPAWQSIKPSRLLRLRGGERGYWRLFRRHPKEVQGLEKAWLLCRRSGTINAPQSVTAAGIKGVWNVTCDPFTFSGLQDDREMIRKRLLEIATDQPPADHRWGGGDYAALHVRLGDFGQPPTEEVLASGAVNNLRIPLSWYVGVVRHLLSTHPNRPVHVVSDGGAEELAPLLEAGATLLRTGSDLGDLYALAGASLLVGSNSTYSRWAAFLGNMPSIWLKTQIQAEQPTGTTTPIHYVGRDEAISVAW